MNKTALAIGLAIILIGGLVIYAFQFINEENEDLQAEHEDNNDPVIEDKEEEEIENEEQDIPEITPVEIGEVAPNFTLKNLDGETISLEDYRGSNVIVNFWASWCPPCREEMPDFQRFYEEYKDKNFTILAINPDESKETITKFMEENQYTFPVLLDTTGEVAYMYMVSGIPTSYIVDKEGVIRYMRVGPMAYPEMQQIIDSLNGNE